MNLAAFRTTKTYDLLMAAPLILWFGGAGVRLRPDLVALGHALLSGRGTWHGALLFFALLASAIFNLLLVWLLLARTPPVRRAPGLVARGFGFVGAFLGVAILYLPLGTPALGWVLASDVLLLVGFTASVVIVSQLGKAFAIMPEARSLVTHGAYAYVRHPLYVAEITGLIGNIILFRQPWAALIGGVVIGLQLVRCHYEERVLEAAFPEYAAYRARTWRFIPYVI
jgi:protein-S-isoprenylcysteine O-methyltransferase Ste14